MRSLPQRSRPAASVTDLTTGEILSRHLIEPDKTYWRKPKQPARPLARHHKLRPMSQPTRDPCPDS